MSDATQAASRAVSRVLRPIRGRLMLAGTLAALGAMLSLVPLAAIAHIAMAALQQDTPMAALWPLAVSALGSLLLGLALIAAGEWVAHLADTAITAQLRLAIVRRLAGVPLGWFTSRASGEVKQALQDDIGILHSLTAHFYTTVGRTVGAIVSAVLYLVIMDWRMALVSLLPFPLFFVFFARANRASAVNMQAFGAGMGRINAALVAFIQGIPVLKAFGAHGKAHERYRRAVDDFAVAFTDFTRPLVSEMANANALIAPVSVLAGVLAFGTGFVALGWITPVQVLPFALVAPGICAPLLLLKYVMHDLNPATGAAQRVLALLETPVLQTPALQTPDGPAPAPTDTRLRVEQVSYAYDGGTPVLREVSFELAPGTVTAIVGASGSGKSTLARLLLRFFDPDQGRITLGGVDLRLWPSAHLYRRIGFVLQDVRLIHASVRDNIALGRPAASQHEVEAAAQMANLHERILMLPRGYDSVIGEDARLSGGEQQRLSIARAVLLDAPLLVLDEPTAAADAENEVLVQQALSRFARGRTLLVIAHRLDTVMHADQIIVLHQGAVCEQGRHAELLARNGRYAQLWACGDYERSTEPLPAQVNAPC